MRQLVECVPNFSEGRDAGKIDAIVQAVLAVPEVVLLDREADADHNRSVLTNLDIVAASGGGSIANIQQFTVPANASGQYVITFTSVTNNALISGIEID